MIISSGYTLTWHLHYHIRGDFLCMVYHASNSPNVIYSRKWQYLQGIHWLARSTSTVIWERKVNIEPLRTARVARTTQPLRSGHGAWNTWNTTSLCSPHGPRKPRKHCVEVMGPEREFCQHEPRKHCIEVMGAGAWNRVLSTRQHNFALRVGGGQFFRLCPIIHIPGLETKKDPATTYRLG